MVDAFNAVFSWVNLSDAAMLSGGGAVSTLPVQNLQDPQPRKVYRTIGTSAFAIADLGSAQAADLLAIAGTNLSTGATGLRVRASNTDPTCTSSLVYDSNGDSGLIKLGPDPRYLGNVFFLFGATQTARYWRIDVTDASLGNVDIGRLWIGPKFVPNSNITVGYGLGYDDTGAQGRSVYGQLHIRTGAKSRHAKLQLDFLSEAEAKASMFEMQRLAGVTGDVLFIENPISAFAIVMAFIGLVGANSSSTLTQTTNGSGGSGLQLFSNSNLGIYAISMDLVERL